MLYCKTLKSKNINTKLIKKYKQKGYDAVKALKLYNLRQPAKLTYMEMVQLINSK